jgi:hypothetical protein
MEEEVAEEERIGKGAKLRSGEGQKGKDGLIRHSIG